MPKEDSFGAAIFAPGSQKGLSRSLVEALLTKGPRTQIIGFSGPSTTILMVFGPIIWVLGLLGLGCTGLAARLRCFEARTGHPHYIQLVCHVFLVHARCMTPAH